jgi:hypothetical protein
MLFPIIGSHASQFLENINTTIAKTNNKMSTSLVGNGYIYKKKNLNNHPKTDDRA